MAEPTFTEITTPENPKIQDGFKTRLGFSLDNTVDIYEDPVQPFGVDGGDLIDTTTQHNEDWETFAVHHLKKTSDGQFTGGYNPGMYPKAFAMVNQLQSVTFHFPNGGRLAAWANLKSWIPDALARRTFPSATGVLVGTQADANGNEEEPVYEPPSGTGT